MHAQPPSLLHAVLPPQEYLQRRIGVNGNQVLPTVSVTACSAKSAQGRHALPALRAGWALKSLHHPGRHPVKGDED